MAWLPEKADTFYAPFVWRDHVRQLGSDAGQVSNPAKEAPGWLSALLPNLHL